MALEYDILLLLIAAYLDLVLVLIVAHSNHCLYGQLTIH